MQVVSAKPEFGAEIFGADLARPNERLVEECWQLFDRYALCVFRGSGLDDRHHVAFSRLFGDLEHAPRARSSTPRFDYPELFDAGNLDRMGAIRMDEKRRLFNKGNQQWHTDSSFRTARSSYSMLLAHVIPPSGGETQFADMRAAYDALPDDLRARLEGLEAEHSIWHSRSLAGYPPATEEEQALIPSARQPLLMKHPRTGRWSLYLARHASHIVGMDRAEGAKLLDELIEFATQPQFVHTHEWQVGDLVVWDNRCTMHRATPFEDTLYPRDMRRTTLIDGSTPTATVDHAMSDA
ncbi:MAG TPA: TauD/TfdA family dioxygenase [Sphingomonadaceae bacterium]|jgi:alpha-ketoglutarate-dependent 2,4-dichlorophenoxyacetate dioxygenase|nr:TauD/TfdA family dioxygenase [Sphingomonadaceae bacterium]